MLALSSTVPTLVRGQIEFVLNMLVLGQSGKKDIVDAVEQEYIKPPSEL